MATGSDIIRSCQSHQRFSIFKIMLAVLGMINPITIMNFLTKYIDIGYLKSKMKTICKSVLWSILFSWLIISGTAYTGIKCDDSGCSLCCITSPLSSKTETVISNCANNSHCGPILSETSNKKDSCCKKKERSFEMNPFLIPQNPGFQIHSINFAYTGPRPRNNRTLRPVFVQYKTRQSIPIYTLTQSFLC